MPKDRLRIALFHNSPGYGNKRAIYYLAKGLVEKGHQVDVFIPQTANEDYLPLRDLGLNVRAYGPIRRPKSINLRPFVLEGVAEIGQEWFYQRKMNSINRKIAKDINSDGYDVVYVDRCRATSSPFILQYLKVPSVYYCHEPWRNGYEHIIEEWQRKFQGNVSVFQLFSQRIYGLAKQLQRNYLKRLDRNNALRANRIVTNSQYTRDYIRHAYGKNALVSYLGVDTAIFKPLGLQRQRLVLSVGRLQQLKRHDLTIRAIGMIPENERPKLVIIADVQSSVNREELEQLAKKEKVSLEFKFNVSDQELVEWYNRAALVTYTAVKEPFGLVALEAMACGTPVVGVLEGGLQESIVDGETGFLVEPTPEACAKAIRTILNNPELGERMGAFGIKHVKQNWTWEAATERLEGHLNEVSKKDNQKCEKKRILYVTRLETFYGGNRCLYELVKKLNPMRYETVLVAPPNSIFKEKFKAIGVSFHELQTAVPFKFKNLSKIWSTNLKLIHFVKKEKISLIHINEESCLAESLFPFFMWAKISGISIIFHLRSAGLVFSAFKRFIFLLGHVVCVSKSIYTEFMVSRRSDFLTRPSKEKVVTIYDGIDTSTFSESEDGDAVKREFNLTGHHIIGCVGAIAPINRRATRSRSGCTRSATRPRA